MPKVDVDLVLRGELLDHLRAALRVGAVILDDQLDRPAGDAAGVVDQLHRRVGGALVPAAIGGADAGAMRLEADLDRLGGADLDVAHEARREAERRAAACHCGQALQRAAARDQTLARFWSLGTSHRLPPPVEWIPVQAVPRQLGVFVDRSYTNFIMGQPKLNRLPGSRAARARTKYRRPSGWRAAPGSATSSGELYPAAA